MLAVIKLTVVEQAVVKLIVAELVKELAEIQLAERLAEVIEVVKQVEIA